jgi:hypothetical protein
LTRVEKTIGRGPGIPLRNTLSLLDDERRRRRVSEIRIDLDNRTQLRLAAGDP